MPHPSDAITTESEVREPPRIAQVLRQGRGDDARLARPREEGARRYRQLLDETETLTHGEVCELLDLTLQELLTLCGERGIVWLQTDRSYLCPVYPAWQFVDGRVVEGLSEVLAALGDLPVLMRYQWLCAPSIPCDALVDEEPRAMLLAGRVGEVVRAARAAGRQGAS